MEGEGAADMPREDDGFWEPVPTGLSNTGLQALGGVYNHTGGSSDACSICLEGLKGSCRRLECTHSFHCVCIDPWLAKKRECPVCKHELS